MHSGFIIGSLLYDIDDLETSIKRPHYNVFVNRFGEKSEEYKHWFTILTMTRYQVFITMRQDGKRQTDEMSLTEVREQLKRYGFSDTLSSCITDVIRYNRSR